MESHARDLDNYVNVARNRRRRAKALLDFERHDDDELGFCKNDIITVSSWLLFVVFFEALHLHTHTHPFNGPLSRTIGVMSCGTAGPLGSVPGMWNHLQGDQVN